MTGAVRAAVVLLAACAACDGLGPEPTGGDIPGMVASQVMYALHHEVTVDGVREAVIDSDSAHFFDDSTAVHLFGVDLKVYSPDGRERAHVTSQTGTLDTRTQAMIARGGALVVTQGGSRTIRTEELHYDPGADRVWSDVDFVMVEPGRTTRGSGFSADAEFQNVRVNDSSAEGIQIDF
ncbi:MAG: LPS export ABC transporter periplasmic protein LptC [Gemmatimonadota bacterium]